MTFLEDEKINVLREDATSTLLPQYEWLRWGLSERQHGNMRLNAGGAPIDPLARARFALELEIPPERLVALRQVHGKEVLVATGKNLEETLEADAVVTAEPRLFLSVTTADCLPVFFVDTKKRLVGLAHAGWRGLLRGVLGETIATFKKMGSRPQDIFAGIGPSIGVCHYEVGMPVAGQFEEELGRDVVVRRDEKLFVDLKKSAERLLHRTGVAPERIKISQLCTFCEERYFSYRRDATVGVQTMMAVIGIC